MKNDKKEPIKIASWEELEKICDKVKKDSDQLDCFILLGLGRSSKTFIFQEDRGIVVCHEIDGTTTYHKTVKALYKSKKTNIGEAIDRGAFYIYSYERDKLEKNS